MIRPRHYLLPLILVVGSLVLCGPTVGQIWQRVSTGGSDLWWALLAAPVALLLAGLGLGVRVDQVAHRRSLRGQRQIWDDRQGRRDGYINAAHTGREDR